MKKIILPLLFGVLVLGGCSSNEKEILQEKGNSISFENINMNDSRTEQIRGFSMNVLNKYDVDTKSGFLYSKDKDIMFMISRRMTITKEHIAAENFEDVYVKNIYDETFCGGTEVIDIEKGKFPDNTIYAVKCTNEKPELRNPAMAQLMIEKNGNLYEASIASYNDVIKPNLISEAVSMINTIKD